MSHHHHPERRKHPRFLLEQVVELGYGKETFIQAQGVNCSPVGILCHTLQPVEPYTQVSLIFKVPAEKRGRTIKAQGVVMRCVLSQGVYYLGIEFENLSDKDREFLKTRLG